MKIGIIAYHASGHLYPMTALARKLQSRGHEVMTTPEASARNIEGVGLDCPQGNP